MTNSADPYQLASEEANWSGSTLFVKAGYILSFKGSPNETGGKCLHVKIISLRWNQDPCP